MAALPMLLAFCTALVQATPTIVEVRTAAPNVIVAVVQTDVTYENGTSSGPDNVDTAAGPGHWQVNGGSPTAIHRYSIPWDELPEVGQDPNLPNWTYPVTTRHRIYLVLGSPLVEGQTYTIANPSYGSTNWTFSARTSFCESIKVNQVGYSKLSTSRFANFGVYMGNEGAGSISMQFNPLPTYKVYDQNTGALLTNGTAVYITNDTANANSGSSGEYVYRLSLNYVPEGGPYYVSVDGAGRSRPFGIGDTYSSNIAYVTMRGMYLHRCGIALTQPFTAFTHAICHTNIYDVRSTAGDDSVDVPPGTPSMFIQGGYHDAGDMDQSAAHYYISTLMLSFFEAFPNRSVDNQYNIPESGNGIPDFLDEIMWGVKLWEYLQITNTSDAKFGGVRAGWAPHGYTSYGVQDAANDTLNYGTFDVQVDCTAEVAGIFAQASRLIRPYDAAHADLLLNRAQWAWNYLANHGNTSEARASVMYAALQLYLATTNSTYHGVFQTAANNVILSPNGFSDRDGYECGNTYYYCWNAHFISYLLPNVPNANPTLVQNLKNKILSCAENGTFMGPPPENQPYPQGVTKYMGWGSATAQGRYADTWMYACLLTNNPATLQRYTNAIAQYADFPLGLNAMNMSYYTGLGVDQPNSPLDCNSYYTKYGTNDGVTRRSDGTLDNHRDAAGNPIGNVPGIVVYGPTDGRSGQPYQMAVSQKLWPAWDSLPGQRHYAQGWSLEDSNEFTPQETMAWNAVMYAFLYTPPTGGNGTLAAPSNFSATALSSSQINLSWTDNANNETGFKIERKTGAGGTYAQIATVGANVTGYNDSGLTAGTTYYYRIRATNAAGDSAYSNEANATTSGGGRPVTTAQRASAPMTIDGNLSEASWSITNTVTKTIVGTPNNTVTFGVLWDDSYLYIGANILDPNLISDSAPYPWQDDALEIYIDANHNRATSYDAYDRQIVQGWNYSTIWANASQTNGILHAWAPITGGYSVEVAIPWSSFGITPSSNTVVGLDVGNDDDDIGGNRQSQVMWAGTANNWTDTSAFGDLMLAGTNGPPPSEEFTNDANTIALYHFNGNYNDSSANGFTLTPSGNVTLPSNPGWMQNPSGAAARFSDLGDQLLISSVPDSAVEPGPSQTPLSIEARIYVRGYKAYSRANANLINLYQDWDARLELYDPMWPASGQPIGPTVVGYEWDVITTAAQWQNAVSLNAWHKFKLTFAANGTANCYIDGNLVSTLTTSVNVGRATPWTISLGNFDGDVDELRISNIVR